MIFAALDTETTGFCEPEHRIIEIHIDLVDLDKQKKIWSYDQRINPLRNIPADAQRVHGISISDVAGKPAWEQVGPLVHKILDKSQFMLIHNAEFDHKFLDMEFGRIGLPALTMPSYCTMENGIWAAPTGKKPSLQELCFACGVDYDTTDAHAADYDVDRMTQCYLKGVSWGFYDIPESLKHSAVAA